MPYTTDFIGGCTISPPLNPAQIMYIQKFNKTRRMKRHAGLCDSLKDATRCFVGLPVGVEGGYFLGASDARGQSEDALTIIDFYKPPEGQPGLCCQWTVTDDGERLEWDRRQNFCDYVEWLEYLIQHFFAPWGVVLNGEIKWCAEEPPVLGIINVENNIVTVEGKNAEKKTILNDNALLCGFAAVAARRIRQLYNCESVGDLGDAEERKLVEALKEFFTDDKRENKCVF